MEIITKIIAVLMSILTLIVISMAWTPPSDIEMWDIYNISDAVVVDVSELCLSDLCISDWSSVNQSGGNTTAEIEAVVANYLLNNITTGNITIRSGSGSDAIIINNGTHLILD